MKSAFALAFLAAAALVACAPHTAATASDGTTGAAPAPAVRSTSAASHGTHAAGAPAASADATQAPVAVAGASAAPASSPRFGDPQAVVATAAPEVPNAQHTAEPAPASTPTAIPYLAPDAPPQILAFSISANTVSPGDVLSGSVTASSNVASVEVRVAGYSYNMTKTAPGSFELAVTVPSVPRMFRRTYPLVAIARNTRGDATQRTTQITIR